MSLTQLANPLSTLSQSKRSSLVMHAQEVNSEYDPGVPACVKVAQTAVDLYRRSPSPGPNLQGLLSLPRKRPTTPRGEATEANTIAVDVDDKAPTASTLRVNSSETLLLIISHALFSPAAANASLAKRSTLARLQERVSPRAFGPIPSSSTHRATTPGAKKTSRLAAHPLLEGRHSGATCWSTLGKWN